MSPIRAAALAAIEASGNATCCERCDEGAYTDRCVKGGDEDRLEDRPLRDVRTAPLVSRDGSDEAELAGGCTLNCHGGPVKGEVE